MLLRVSTLDFAAHTHTHEQYDEQSVQMILYTRWSLPSKKIWACRQQRSRSRDNCLAIYLPL